MNLSKTLGSLGSSAATQSVFKRKDIADLTAIFNYYDTEHSGSVTGSNVKHMLFALGFVTEDLFVTETRLYSREEFLNTAAQLMSKDTIRRDEKKLARKIFQMLDYGGHGTVDPLALKRFMESTGIKVTMEQAENFVAAADRGEEGLTFGVDDLDHYLEKFYYPFLEELNAKEDSDVEEDRKEDEDRRKREEQAERELDEAFANESDSDEKADSPLPPDDVDDVTAAAADGDT